MSEEVNLESIILKVYGCKDVQELQRDFVVSVQMIKEIAIEAIRQALELANENAYTEESVVGYGWDVNKNSILNTINQIK